MSVKPWYKSKTVWIGIATVIGAAGSAIAGEASWMEAVLAAVGLINIFLRTQTDSGLGKPIDLSKLSDEELLAQVRRNAPGAR